MGRTVPFDSLAVCDVCGKLGAFDFMGDLVCFDCCDELNSEPSTEDDLDYEEEENGS